MKWFILRRLSYVKRKNTLFDDVEIERVHETITLIILFELINVVSLDIYH